MKSRWNAKADTSSSIILWAGGLAAGFICAMWLAQNLYPEHGVVQKADNELSDLRLAINTACRMDKYWKNYYPHLKEGTMVIQGSEVCINTGPCKAFFYESGLEPLYADGKLTIDFAMPCQSIESCKVIYYSSDSPPRFENGSLVIDGAISCSNKHDAVTRCRVVYCDTGIASYFDLKSTYYINITKAGSVLYAQKN